MKLVHMLDILGTRRLVGAFKFRFLSQFSHDVTAAILVFQNNEAAAMSVYQTNPVGVEHFSYVNTSFCCNKFACELAT